MRLVAYDKKTGKYIDSLTTSNAQHASEFKEDFKDCRVECR